MFFLSVLDFQRNTLPSFDILAEALVEQVESRARRDDAAWRSESAHDDAAIMAAIHPIPHLDLPTELRHDSIVEYQRLELALRDAYGVDARGEARTWVFEGVADKFFVDIQMSLNEMFYTLGTFDDDIHSL